MSEYFRRHIKKEHYPVYPSNIRFKTLFKNCILEALKKRQWKETDHEIEWDIYWAEKEWIYDLMDHTHLSNNQKVNHFRNHYELTRKDLMIKNLKRHKKNLEKEGKLDEAASYNFFPLTYNLPGEYSIFCEEFKKNNGVWIMKPISKSQGKGIFLFNKLSQISQWKNDLRWKPDTPQSDPYIVQKYINNPLIIGGKKFDMRIYCLCTSYSPLVAYLYRTGFARFTHHRYDNDDITNSYVHLTNVAIQKTSENYDDKIGGKWELKTLKLYLMSKYGQEKVSESFNNIQQLIIKALQSVQKVLINDKHCFELYGFDVLLDSNLKPWLLEVNASPSMTANTPYDAELKINLLDDVFTIIDLEKIMTGQEEQIGGFDLIFKGNPIKLPSSSTYSTLLGCYNNRAQQLKKLAKSTSIRLSQTQEEIKKKNPTKDRDVPIIGGISSTSTSTTTATATTTNTNTTSTTSTTSSISTNSTTNTNGNDPISNNIKSRNKTLISTSIPRPNNLNQLGKQPKSNINNNTGVISSGSTSSGGASASGGGGGGGASGGVMQYKPQPNTTNNNTGGNGNNNNNVNNSSIPNGNGNGNNGNGIIQQGNLAQRELLNRTTNVIKSRDNSKAKTTIGNIASNGQNNMLGAMGNGAGSGGSGSGVSTAKSIQQNLVKQQSSSNTNQKGSFNSQQQQQQQTILSRAGISIGIGSNMNNGNTTATTTAATTTSSTLANSGLLTLTDPLKFKNINSLVLNDNSSMIETTLGDIDKSSRIITSKMNHSNEITKARTYSCEAATTTGLIPGLSGGITTTSGLGQALGVGGNGNGLGSYMNMINTSNKDNKPLIDDLESKESKDIQENLLNQLDSEDELGQNNE